MGGPKGVNQVVKGLGDRGEFSPTDALINFAVPSITTIDRFQVSDINTDKIIPTGIILPSLTTLQALPENEYMLCADGKKVTAGFDSKGGDVDMFSFEDGVTFKEREKELKDNLNIIEELKLSSESDNNHLCKEKIMKTFLIVSKRLKECKELALRQKLGLEKFKTMGGERWKESKYVYVISALQASIFQIRDLIRDAVGVITDVFHFLAYMSNSMCDYVIDRPVDQSYEGNLHVLNPMYESHGSVVDPRYIKQRTDLWHAIRGQVKVFGSTLYSAIGLRGLIEQKNHNIQVIQDLHIDIAEEVRERMIHGTKHDIDAIATIVAKVLPVYFPNKVFVEEGCYVIPGDNYNILGVLSPDGSIRNRTGDKAIAAVEI
jgi:hypothetical protein